MAELDEYAKALLASQEELVGSLTHDLKGLLSGLEGGIYILNSGLKKEKPDRIGQGVEMIQRNLARMRRKVSSSLYYVKNRQNDWQSLDAEALAASVEKSLSDQAAHLGTTLKIEVGAGSFEADEFAIHSLLVNLVEYSLEACALAKLKSSPAVTLQTTAGEDHIVFVVLAEGFVIEEEAQKHALGDVYSPRGVDRSHLGLFIANKIAKSHNGTLQISGRADEETTRFTVKLPLAKPGGESREIEDSIQERLAKEWDDTP